MKFPLQTIYNWYRNAIRHPKYRWWIILGTLVYLLSPLDISPDIFPIIGEIDDAVLVTLLVGELSAMLIERVKSSQFSLKTNSNPNFETTTETTVDIKAEPIN